MQGYMRLIELQTHLRAPERETMTRESIKFEVLFISEGRKVIGHE
jgi:hypothetical protein